MHNKMKRMNENLGAYAFYKWHQETKEYFKDFLCGYFSYYQRIHKFFIVILFNIGVERTDIKLPSEHLESRGRFIEEMSVFNSEILENPLPIL